MAPPIKSRSTFCEQVFDDADLVGDLGASHDGDVRVLGLAQAGSRGSRSSFSTRKPIARRSGGNCSGTATIDASSRWQVPKASLT